MITVVEGPKTQYGTQTLQGVLTVKELKDVFKVDNYDREKGRPGEEAGYQRNPEQPRIVALAKSLAKGLVVSTSILVNNREASPKNISFDTKGVSQIKLPSELWAVDAQHRCLAWLELHENAADYGLTKKDVGDYKVNFTMLWGASIEEEVLTFFDVNHFGKGIKVENRLELDVYLNKQGVATHRKNEAIVEIDNIVEELSRGEIWKDKIRFANSKTGIVPKSAIVTSLDLIFKDPNLDLFSSTEKKKLIFSVWEAVASVYTEIINEDENPKDWALQKAIGVNIIHRMIPFIYADIQHKNNRIASIENKDDAFDPKVWKKYFKKIKENHKDVNRDNQDVDGVEFWRTGKDGAAGAYSSGQGRNTVLQKLTKIVREN